MTQSLRMSHDRQNEIIRLEYDVAITGTVSLSIRDLQGRLVRNILSAQQEYGTYRIDEEIGSLAPAVYVLKLETPSGAAVVKLLK
jgi:hypothetical protein